MINYMGLGGNFGAQLVILICLCLMGGTSLPLREHALMNGSFNH